MSKVCCNDLLACFDSADPDCFENKTSAKENNKIFTIDITIQKKEKFCRIKVDNCLIKDKKTKRCDFVFVRCSNKDFYFVELKGGGQTEAAFEQLQSTIKLFQDKLDLELKHISAYIVSSSIPSASNQRFKNLKKKFKKDIGLIPEVGTTRFIKRI